MKKQSNFRKALERMLEHIKSKRICIGEAMYVLSDDLMLKNPLIVRTLEEFGCIQYLGRLNHKTGALYQRAYGNGFVSQIHARACMRTVDHPWGHKLWVVNTIRADQINPQLVLTKPTLEAIEKLYGPQIDIVERDERPTYEVPWPAEPPD
jgi:hypothetical protein